MRHCISRTQFDRDVKRMKRRNKDVEKLLAVVFALQRDGRLPSLFRPHKLQGEYDGLWECHIEPDWLLLYELKSKTIFLHRTGSHTDLFK